MRTETKRRAEVVAPYIEIMEVNQLLDWLVKIRGDRSQCKVAKEIGIAQSTYASIEVGSRRPSVDTAKRIGATMGFEWTRFFEEPKDQKVG